MTPLVSVVITTFNHALYIAEAIEGAINQCTNFDFEVVIGEDCSTDTTLSTCNHYQAMYPEKVRVLAHTQNIGMRRNYRESIAACKGKYIAICDGDDYFSDKNKLQMQVDALVAGNFDMCYTRSERKSAEKSEVYPTGALHTTLESMLILNTAENCTVMARKEDIEQYYKQVDPLSKAWKTDDLPMWLWFSAQKRICTIDRVTAVHRILDTSVSHNTDYKKRLEFCDSLSDIMVWFDTNYNSSKLHKFLLKRKQNTALWTLSYNGSVSDFICRWWRDCSITPSLFANIASYGLFLKKILYRMWI